MAPVIDLHDVTVIRNGKAIVDRVNWTVNEGERWVILGANGAGKSTIMQMAGASLFPSSGTVDILDERIGRVDVFELRPRIGFAGSALAKRIPDTETVQDAVMTASYAVTGRWNEEYDAIDERRARRVLAEWRLLELEHRTFGTLSDGERKRVQIARAVMVDPELLLLDEPTASMDLGAREGLLTLLTQYAQSEWAPAIVMVTHHVEEIPVGITHALLLRDGAIVASGAIAEVMTAANLSKTFDLPLELEIRDGRYAAWATKRSDEG